jgi:hypothetical protein
MKFVPVLTILAALSAASSATAQVVISGSYYEESKIVNCDGVNFCQVVFTAVPQNVLVTDVSCYVVAGAPAYQSYIGVSDSANGGAMRRNSFFRLTQMTTSGSVTYYAAAIRTNFLFGSGHWPTINLASFTSGGFFNDCKNRGHATVGRSR